MSFGYRNNTISISNIEQYPNNDELIEFGDSVKGSFGYTIEKVYLNFMSIPIVVCRRDGVNVVVPPEQFRHSDLSGKHRNKFLILTYHRFGQKMTGNNCFKNRYSISNEMLSDKRIQTYLNDLEKLTFTQSPYIGYQPKESNVIKQNTVITSEMLEVNEGSFYCFGEDVVIAREDAEDGQVHPFQIENAINGLIDRTFIETTIEIKFNDCERKYPDIVYYMIGNMPSRLVTTRDCLLGNGLYITYKDAINKKITKRHYPIEEIIDGSNAEKLDFAKPIVYRSREDAVNYGRGDEVVKNTITRMKMDYEMARNEANHQKLAYDERVKKLQIEQDKLDETRKNADREFKIRQDEFEQKVRLEELRLKTIREDAIAREKHQSEQWKGMLAIASGIFGILMIVLKR